jgi:hypothetical protein
MLGHGNFRAEIGRRFKAPQEYGIVIPISRLLFIEHFHLTALHLPSRTQ